MSVPVSACRVERAEVSRSWAGGKAHRDAHDVRDLHRRDPRRHRRLRGRRPQSLLTCARSRKPRRLAKKPSVPRSRAWPAGSCGRTPSPSSSWRSSSPPWPASPSPATSRSTPSRRAHGGETISWARYLVSSQFGEAVLENWESEFLQFTFYILATVWLVQRGSPESKKVERAGIESKKEQQVEHAATRRHRAGHESAAGERLSTRTRSRSR